MQLSKALRLFENDMTSTAFKKLDDFLNKSDHESMDWCDGGESEMAEKLIEKFDEQDWKTLSEVSQNRSLQWQGCLVSILCPQYGAVAQYILVKMTGSKNPDIAFAAMYAISFYCGINANSAGPFIDDCIVHEEFRAKLRLNSEFLASIPQVGNLVGRNYELLQSILRGKP